VTCVTNATVIGGDIQLPSEARWETLHIKENAQIISRSDELDANVYLTIIERG